MFDYEWATVQHNVNCRLASAVVVPDAIPPQRLYRYGAQRQAARVRGTEGGVLPGGLHAGRGGAGRAGPGRRAPDRGRAHAAGGVAVSPLRERPVRAGARAPAPAAVGAGRAAGGAAAHRLTARGAGEDRRVRAARAGDRRAVADRLLGAGDLGGRDDEPRGGGAGRAGVHDVRGTPGGGRRAADRRRPAAPPAARPATWSWPSAARERSWRACAAIRACWWTCCSRRCTAGAQGA